MPRRCLPASSISCRILHRRVEGRAQSGDAIGGNAGRPEEGPADFRRRQHQLHRVAVQRIGDEVAEQRNVAQFRILGQAELEKDVDLLFGEPFGLGILERPVGYAATPLQSRRAAWPDRLRRWFDSRIRLSA